MPILACVGRGLLNYSAKGHCTGMQQQSCQKKNISSENLLNLLAVLKQFFFFHGYIYISKLGDMLEHRYFQCMIHPDS
jgi:hypothetical protein